MNSLLHLLYIITFIVSTLLILSGLMLVLKKFIHPGYNMVEGTVVANSCKIGEDPSGCGCGLDRPKKYKGLNCVQIAFGPSGSTVDNVVVGNKYTDGSKIQLLIDSNASSPITADKVQIYNPDTFINGIIMICIGLLFFWFAWSGMYKKKKSYYNNNTIVF
jgi:hypothetical protein